MISNTTMEYISNHYDELGGKVSALDPIHPCFLYESIWCLIGFIILHFYLKHRKFDGEVFLMYTGWYGLGRFFIEGLRTDSLYLGNIRVSQLVAGTKAETEYKSILGDDNDEDSEVKDTDEKDTEEE